VFAMQDGMVTIALSSSCVQILVALVMGPAQTVNVIAQSAFRELLVPSLMVAVCHLVAQMVRATRFHTDANVQVERLAHSACPVSIAVQRTAITEVFV
jgi:hypothetical protein